MRPQLREAIAQIGEQAIVTSLSPARLRLSTAMAIGVEMPDVAGFTVALRQRDREWSSSGEHADIALERVEHGLGQGDQFAIGISIAVDVSDDVLAYLVQERIPVAKLVNSLPAHGVGCEAVNGPDEVRGLAQGLLDAPRARACDQFDVEVRPATPAFGFLPRAQVTSSAQANEEAAVWCSCASTCVPQQPPESGQGTNVRR